VREALDGERIGMALGYFLIALPATPWWRVKARSGGQVVEQAVHIIDLARYLLGEVDRVFADYALRANWDEPGYASDDVYSVNLRFRGGAVGHLAACSILHRRFNVGLDVLCKGHVYRIEDDGVTVDGPDGTRRIERTNDAGLAESEAFLRAVATGDRTAILSDYADALRTQRVALAANQSAELGLPVPVLEEP
jgi:predicted dehydrogenase